MSSKRREILEFLLDAGPRGVKKQDLINRFFASTKPEIVLRTTIHYINAAIAPLKIYTKGGVIRLKRPDY